jgi:nucleotide-binding universal stress UspA family protein
MKIMATLDGSPFSESILPLLIRLAALPNAEFVLVRAVDDAHGVRTGEMKRPMQAVGFSGQGATPMAVPQNEPGLAVSKEQAVESMLADARDYLERIGQGLPGGTKYTVLPLFDKDAAGAIIRAASETAPEVIVIATHGHTGIVHALVGSVTEKVPVSPRYSSCTHRT